MFQIDPAALQTYCASLVLDVSIMQNEIRILKEEIDRLVKENEELKSRNIEVMVEVTDTENVE